MTKKKAKDVSVKADGAIDIGTSHYGNLYYRNAKIYWGKGINEKASNISPVDYLLQQGVIEKWYLAHYQNRSNRLVFSYIKF